MTLFPLFFSVSMRTLLNLSLGVLESCFQFYFSNFWFKFFGLNFSILVVIFEFWVACDTMNWDIWCCEWWVKIRMKPGIGNDRLWNNLWDMFSEVEFWVIDFDACYLVLDSWHLICTAMNTWFVVNWMTLVWFSDI